MALPNPELMLPPSEPAVNRGKFFLYGLIILVVAAGLWLSQQPHVQETIVDWPNHSLWDNLTRLVGGQDTQLQGEADDRINFLLLGQGGIGHDGPFLTDTMMLVSLKPSTGQVALLSIPRDLDVNIPGYGFNKINSANAFGETKGAGQGAILASQVVSKVFNLPIQYYVRLDFAGFSKLIDQVGGVGVNVTNGFTDTQFPDDNDNGYRTITFTPAAEAVRLANLLKPVKQQNISSHVLSADPGGLLHETIGVDGAYLLLPNVPNYSEIQTFAANLFEVNRVEAEGAIVALENGTTTTGLAEATALTLKTQGFNVTQTGNADQPDFPHTLIYDYSGGTKPLTRQVLQSLFHASAISLEKPPGDTSPDFQVIIGADYLVPKS